MTKFFVVFAIVMLGSGLPLAVAAQATRRLPGTNWVLKEYAVQRAAPVPAVGDQRPTLMFGIDGRLSGFSGCNTFSGPYTESTGKFNVGPLATTLRACADDALTRQEQLTQRVLNAGTLLSTLQGSELSLSAPAGMLTFLKADRENMSPTTPGELPTTGTSAFGLASLLLLLAPVVFGLGLGLRQRACCAH